MRRGVVLLAAAVAVGLALPQANLRAGGKETATVVGAANVLHEVAKIPAKGIPEALMRDASGIVIIPGMIKGGFLIGGHRGKGVVVMRDKDGRWGNPVFVTLTGGSFGWQAGLESVDLVLVCRTARSVEWVLAGRDLTLGVNAGLAAGPVGRQAEAGTDARLRAEIYSYSRSRGLFGGLAITGGFLRVDQRANAAFYNAPGIGAREILMGANLAVPPAAVQLRDVLNGPLAPPGPGPVLPVPVVPPVPK
jgi:lipid-binding SYLF domain-containing protein